MNKRPAVRWILLAAAWALVRRWKAA